MTIPDSRPPGSGGRRGILLRIERFSRERFRVVFLASLVVFVAASWLATRIKLESDVLNLIPKGNRQVDTFRDALHEFGALRRRRLQREEQSQHVRRAAAAPATRATG